MKKLMLLLAIVALIALSHGASLFAQEADNTFTESDYYYYNFPIEKIYSYRMGYIVLYRNVSNRIVRTYVPEVWFVDIGGKGEIVGLDSGKEWPSMTVYYYKGEFSHVRLKLRRNRLHETWGMVPLNVNIDDYFQNIEEVKLEFF
jgi:hypothetical protein